MDSLKIVKVVFFFSFYLRLAEKNCSALNTDLNISDIVALSYFFIIIFLGLQA